MFLMEHFSITIHINEGENWIECVNYNDRRSNLMYFMAMIKERETSLVDH